MSKPYSIRINANFEEIALGVEPVVLALKEAGVDPRICYKVRLALDEILTNVVSYAYDGQPGSIEIRYEIKEEPAVIEILIIDNGKPFNPLDSEEPDLNNNVLERKIGGLGIYIVRNAMDDVEYVRYNDQNILQIKKYI